MWVCMSLVLCSIKEQNVCGVWGTTVSRHQPPLVWNRICFSSEPQTAEREDPDKTVFLWKRGLSNTRLHGFLSAVCQSECHSAQYSSITGHTHTLWVPAVVGRGIHPQQSSKSLISWLLLHRDMLLLGLSRRNVLGSSQTLCHHQQLVLSKAKAQLPCCIRTLTLQHKSIM